MTTNSARLSQWLKKNSSESILRSYHITDRDEGHDDDDDEGGGKQYPSRTFYGQAWEITKNHPWLTEPLRFLGLPITPPFYGLNWTLTNAQVQLMCFDTPITVYPKNKGKKKSGKGKSQFSSPSTSKIEAAAQEWKEKYEGKDPTIAITDYL